MNPTADSLNSKLEVEWNSASTSIHGLSQYTKAGQQRAGGHSFLSTGPESAGLADI